MNFEDRLRDQLGQQADELTVQLDANEPRVRARRRQIRRRFGAACAVLAVVGASAGWIAAQTGDSDVADIATEPDTRDVADETPSDSPPAQAEEATDPGAALVAPLVFEPIDADGAPGGFNVFNRGASGDLYYVLSTAPGLREEDAYAEEGSYFLRNDTLYRWSGDGWSSSQFTDRFVTTIGSGGGLLYTVSTGSANGASAAVGSSRDGGTTWDWVPLDVGDGFDADRYSLTSAAGPAGHLVVAWSAPVADYEEAFRLANDAGLAIGWETHQILDVTLEGIHYVPNEPVDSCSQRYWEGIDAAAPYPAEFEAVDGAYEDGDEPTADELAAYESALMAWERDRSAAAETVLAGLADDTECAAFADCQRAQTSWEQARQARMEQRLVELGALEEGETINQVRWDELDDATREAVGALEEEIYGADAGPDWPSADCESILWGPGFSPDDVVTVTWESLGVTPPASWGGAIAAYLVDGDVVTELDVPFRPGFVQAVTALDGGFQVDIVDQPGTWWADYENPTGPEISRYTGGADGWTESTTTTGGGYDSAVGADGSQYSIRWADQNGGPGLYRTSGDDTSFIDAAQLFGSDLPRETGISTLDAGDVGVAVGVIDYSGGRSIVSFSPDGVTWASTDLDGLWLDGIIVGSDGVMLFVHPFDQPGETNVLMARP